jgi:hypothetical protein
MEQSEKTARLIGENYDRFEELKLNMFRSMDLYGVDLTRCLQKYYPNVKIEKLNVRLKSIKTAINCLVIFAWFNRSQFKF